MTTTPKSKRSRFGGSTTVTANLGAIVSQSRADSVAAELIDISKVLPDPENARHHQLDFENPTFIDDADPYAEQKRHELELIEGLARTIENVGLINPVQVTRSGNGYQLVTGHRRLLAHLLLGRETILATIARAPKTRQAQFVENYQRKDTTLSERLDSMQLLLGELGLESAAATVIADKLQELTGINRRMSFRWSALLTGHEIVREAVRAGRVTDMKTAEKISSLPVEEAARALEQLGEESAEGQGDADEGQAPAPDTGSPDRQRMRGRRKQAVPLGKVKNPDVVRYVVRQVLGDDAYAEIDWTDYDAVGKAFQEMLTQVAEKIK